MNVFLEEAMRQTKSHRLKKHEAWLKHWAKCVFHFRTRFICMNYEFCKKIRFHTKGKRVNLPIKDGWDIICNLNFYIYWHWFILSIVQKVWQTDSDGTIFWCPGRRKYLQKYNRTISNFPQSMPIIPNRKLFLTCMSFLWIGTKNDVWKLEKTLFWHCA